MKKFKFLIAALLVVTFVMTVTTIALACGTAEEPTTGYVTICDVSQSPVKARLTEPVHYDNEALETTGDGNAGDETAAAAFFSWATLATYAGAVLFCTIATQYLKSLEFMQKIPTQVTSYGVALIGLVCATIFSGQFTASGIVLCFVNAFVVALAANGAYDNIKYMFITETAEGEQTKTASGFEDL